MTFAAIKSEAKLIREQLKGSRFFGHASIRDAINLAVDNLHNLDAEKQEERG